MTEVFAYFTPLHLLWFAVGGGFGAALRYSISQLFVDSKWQAGGWPMATWLVNLSGALALGLAAAYFNDFGFSPAFMFWEIGVLGGYTTMSSFALETTALIQARRRTLAFVYAISSGVGAVAALMLGFTLGGLLS